MCPTALDNPMANKPAHIHGSVICVHTKGTASDTSAVAIQPVYSWVVAGLSCPAILLLSTW
ncbi:hypothetical protein D3C87_2033010 [compost metagenome]